MGLLQRDEVADQREGKVEPVVVDVRGDEHVVRRGVLLRELGGQPWLLLARLDQFLQKNFF